MFKYLLIVFLAGCAHAPRVITEEQHWMIKRQCNEQCGGLGRVEYFDNNNQVACRCYAI